MRPDGGFVGGPDQPEYGGGGPLGNIEGALIRDVAAMMDIVEIDGRSVLLRSICSRLIIDAMLLRSRVSFRHDPRGLNLESRAATNLCLMFPSSTSIARSEAVVLQI